MSILSRYAAARFFRPFFYSFALFSILIFMGDVFDRMNLISSGHSSMAVLLEYLWLGVPYWAVRTVPMATLLATLLCISGFVQSGEWIGILAGGYTERDVWRPILLCSVLVAGVSLLAQETVLPLCFSRRQSLWREKIHPESDWQTYRRVAYLSGPGEFLEALALIPDAGKLIRPTLSQLGPDGVAMETDAAYALWKPGRGRWVFFEGRERVKQDASFSSRGFREKETNLAVAPAQLVPRSREPDEMSLLELWRYAKRRAFLGGSARQLEVAWHSKLSYPWTNVVLCALGIPIALRLRRAGKAASFTAAVAVSFSYLWAIEIAKALGTSGALSPWAAAWTPNAAFGALAAWMLFRA